MSHSGTQDMQLWARLHHYHLDPFALKRFADFFSELQVERQEDRQLLLQEIFSALKRFCAKDRTIDQTKMNDAINLQITKIRGVNVTVEKDASVHIVPLAKIPHVRVNELSEELRIYPADINGIHKGRVEALRNRYLLARRRSLRSEVYRRGVHLVSGSGDGSIPLLTSSGLEGIAQDCVIAVLGLLSRRGDAYLLEDLRGAIPLSFEENSLATLRASTFVLEGFMIIVVGTWNGERFRVFRANLPPAERREITLKDAGPSVDFFGLAPTDKIMSKEAEQHSVQSVIVFLAHIHLDRPETHQQLQNFFRTMEERGEQELEDTTFVLIGSFCSISLLWDSGDNTGDTSYIQEDGRGRHLKILLNQLGESIATNAPTAASHSNFILIPGPQDITLLGGVFPQPPIPTSFTSGLKKRLKHFSVAPNPCRLRFFTHEMIVCRRDYLRTFQKAERHCWGSYDVSENKNGNNFLSPREKVEEELSSGDLPKCEKESLAFERVTKAILDEAHLCPDQLSGGVLWKMDDALNLPVLPHLLILCDSVEQWECFYKDTHVVNPGSFSVSGTFLWYTPADRECSIGQLS